jgi:hypothetical protein
VKRLAALALAAAVAGCSSGGPPPAHARRLAVPPPAAGDPASPAASGPSRLPLTARVVLPARTMPGGSAMTGYVVVSNRTGHALHVTGCLALFGVALASRTYHPAVGGAGWRKREAITAWPGCRQRLTIPAGRTRYRVEISASYSECTEGLPQGSPGACLPGGGPPPLPPGDYRTQLLQSRPLAPAPAPITVRVTQAPLA